MPFKSFIRNITTGFASTVFSIILLTAASFAQNTPLAVKGDQEAFGNLQVVSQFGNVVFADQPDKATVGMLKDQDIKLVLSIRGLNEDTGFDERKAVEEQGITFIQIPYMSGREINDDALTEIMEIVKTAESNGTKMMLHCTHSTRAGSVLGAALYRDYGFSKEDANALAKEAGLKSETFTAIHNLYLDSVR